MPSQSLRVVLVVGALTSSPQLLVGPVSLPRKPKVVRAAEDWRSFRARLLEREPMLTAEAPDRTKEVWMHSSPLIEKGSVLIAKPGDWSSSVPIFHKSVILITEHDEDYSAGFVLNRPSSRRETYGRLEFNVWIGGPVGFDRENAETQQFCLHREPLSGSDFVAPGIYVTEPWAASSHIMENKAKVDDFMLFLGRCVWGPGQLQSELDKGVYWDMVATDTEALLSFLPRQQRALRRSNVLSRGLPLWRRLQSRLPPEPDRIPEDLPGHIRQRLVEFDLERERDADSALLKFMEEDVNRQAPAASSQGEASQGEGEPPWQEMVQKILFLMKQDLTAMQQENCCEALRNLIVDQSSRSLASELGAAELVISAMKVHEDAPGVQGHCAGTLTHLAAGLRERQLIFDSDGVDVVVGSMKQHETIPLVQYKACAVLTNLAVDLGAQVEVASSGAIPAIVRAMDRHADERLVQDYCMGALYNISRAPQNMSELTSAGGGKVVKEALARHPDAPTVRRVGQDLAEALES